LEGGEREGKMRLRSCEKREREVADMLWTK
jgi:hypothetical protein